MNLFADLQKIQDISYQDILKNTDYLISNQRLMRTNVINQFNEQYQNNQEQKQPQKQNFQIPQTEEQLLQHNYRYNHNQNYSHQFYQNINNQYYQQYQYQNNQQQNYFNCQKQQKSKPQEHMTKIEFKQLLEDSPPIQQNIMSEIKQQSNKTTSSSPLVKKQQYLMKSSKRNNSNLNTPIHEINNNKNNINTSQFVISPKTDSTAQQQQFLIKQQKFVGTNNTTSKKIQNTLQNQDDQDDSVYYSSDISSEVEEEEQYEEDEDDEDYSNSQISQIFSNFVNQSKTEQDQVNQQKKQKQEKLQNQISQQQIMKKSVLQPISLNTLNTKKNSEECQNLIYKTLQEQNLIKQNYNEKLSEDQNQKQKLLVNTKNSKEQNPHQKKNNKQFNVKIEQDDSAMSMSSEESYSQYQQNYQKNNTNDNKINQHQWKRGPYNKFSTEQRKKAVSMYEKLKDFKKVSMKLNIPSKNIRRWYHKGPERKKGGGRRQLDPIMEQKVVDTINQYYTNKQKQISRNQIAQLAKKFSSFPDTFKASKGWIDKFIKRFSLQNHVYSYGSQYKNSKKANNKKLQKILKQEESSEIYKSDIKQQQKLKSNIELEVDKLFSEEENSQNNISGKQNNSDSEIQVDLSSSSWDGEILNEKDNILQNNTNINNKNKEQGLPLNTEKIIKQKQKFNKNKDTPNNDDDNKENII